MGDLIPCRKMFTQTLLELAREDKTIIAVTSDATGSATLNDFVKELPEQFVEVGIAEQNEIGISAGLAMTGKKPFACAPASFLSARCLEQIKVDLAYSNQNVKAIGISGGISYGALGMSHHSLHDIAVMRAIPNMTIIIPSDRWQTREMTKALANFYGPVYVRLGRGAVEDIYTHDSAPFQIGKANVIHDGTDMTIIACGELVKPSLLVAEKLGKEGIHIRVLDMHTMKPIDKEAIILAAEQTGKILTVEEHNINGGLGNAVAQVVCENCPVPMKMLAIPDEITISGESKEVFQYYGLDVDGIQKSAKELLKK